MKKKPHPFTERRLVQFADTFRERHGQLPTLADFEAGGFPAEWVEGAVKKKQLVSLYVTLTNGSIVRGYKKT